MWILCCWWKEEDTFPLHKGLLGCHKMSILDVKMNVLYSFLHLLLVHMQSASVGLEPIKHCVGENVTLRCAEQEHVNSQTDVFTWKTDDETIAEFKTDILHEDKKYKNRIERSSIEQNTFSVVLKNVSTSDSGKYSCYLNRVLQNEVQLDVTEPPAAECVKPTESQHEKHVEDEVKGNRRKISGGKYRTAGKTGMEDTKLDEDVEKAAPTPTWAISLGVCCAVLVLVAAGVYIYRRRRAGRGNQGGVDAGCTDAESVPVQPKRPDNTEEETPHEHHYLTADHTNGDLTTVQKSLKSSSTMSESA